jgi:putative ABC transport system permease protein
MSGTLEDLLREFVYEAPQFEAAIFGVFAAIAILLVAVGVYGIMAYTASMRTHEIGVRMAMGAQRSDIVAVILKGGLGLIAAGILAGLLASVGLTRFLAGEVWGVPTTDPWTFGIVVLCILLTGLIACALPAWRASRLDPLITLRHQL